MKTFEQLREELSSISQYITEELHQELQGVLDSGNLPLSHKLNQFTRTVRGLIKRGIDTGLENDKPLKGSSRAVFLSKEPHKLTIDKQEVGMPVVHKIAFPGQLDRYRPGKPLLGELQNQVESDHFIRNNYGMLREGHDGKFTTNSSGVLAPVIHNHEDYHHLTMGKITPLTAADMREATITSEFPKGITHKDFHNAIQHEYNLANGQRSSSLEVASHDKVGTHPLVENFTDFMHMTGNHPADYGKRNMGIWHHPLTGKKYAVASDYGFSSEVQKEYQKARRDSQAHKRNY